MALGSSWARSQIPTLATARDVARRRAKAQRSWHRAEALVARDLQRVWARGLAQGLARGLQRAWARGLARGLPRAGLARSWARGLQRAWARGLCRARTERDGMAAGP